MTHRLVADVLRNETLQSMVQLFTRGLGRHEAQQMSQQIQRMFAHSMENGKLGRACLALDTYRALKPHASERELRRAATISTSIELLQTFFLIEDDIMDSSETRRGKQCWYKTEGVGMKAINDGLMFDVASSGLVWSEMRNHPKQIPLLRDIHEAKMLTVSGQELDCLTKGHEECTWGRYEQIVRRKTSHYSFTLPIRMGFHMADRIGYESLTPLTYKIGYLFQSQDDHLDCFGNANKTGKKGTDLAEGKCTWLSCKTMELLNASPHGNNASNNQGSSSLRQKFLTSFGRHEARNVDTALDVMRELRVDEHFQRFEAAEIKAIEEDIERVDVVEVRPVLRAVLEKMHRRDR